ncbi:MAG: hypothetical protein J3R72DRAFT_496590 [Linnemannia gamsii]|nr:MAG: hypothetical protein J3R72DRAFT_496590 [Linnemannia gamsii]
MSSIPQEIIDLIAPHLTLHDLADCSRVSLMSAAFIRNKHLVQEAVTTDPGLLLVLCAQRHNESPVPQPTGLQSLALRFEGQSPWALTTTNQQEDIVEPTTNTAAAVARVEEMQRVNLFVAWLSLLSNITNLRTLRLDRGCLRGADRAELLPSIIQALPTNLLTLEICFNDPGPPGDNKLMPLTFPTPSTDYQKFQLATRLYQNQEPFVALKNLAIFGRGHDDEDDISRLAFLVRCNHLVKLDLGAVDNRIGNLLVFDDGAGPLLRTLCPCLSELVLSGTSSFYDSTLAKLLRCSQSGWRTVEIEDAFFFGRLAYAALMESVATTLENLQVKNWRGFRQAWCLGLLRSTTREQLRRIGGIDDGDLEETTKELTVNAQDAYQEHHMLTVRREREGLLTSNHSWIALTPSLEYLQLRIIGVPRANVVSLRNGERLSLPDNEPRGHYDVQKWIYTQLADLSGLQELVVGKRELNWSRLAFCGIDPYSSSSIDIEEALRDRFETFQYDCLEFSMASGLKILSGLTELRVLDVRSTAHNIGVEELDWMHVHWPQLETIRGLESPREWTCNPKEAEAATKAVERWIDNHPNGIGSSFVQK